MKCLLFSEESYDLDFVLSQMEPNYVESTSLGVHHETNLEKQKDVFRVSSESKERQGIFVDILCDKCQENAKYLLDFVWLVTGSIYIRRSDFRIIVEFNFDECADPTSIPEVHTCENTIKFPGLAYDGNHKMLEEKLEYAMSYAKCCSYDME
jgi:HECT-domain (ubiquitin-transferase)